MGARLHLALFTVLAIAFCSDAVNSKSAVNLDVYLESLCPDSRKFVIKHLWPVYQQLEDRINLRMVPYGNARVTGEPGSYKFNCQHGPDECYGNIAQTCAIEIMNNTKESLKFVFCAFHYQTQQGVIDKCVESEELRSKIKFCTDGPLGNNLEYKMAKLTNALKPRHTFIPWITVNGEGSRDINNQANKDLLHLVCKQLKVDVPAVCARFRGLWNFYQRFDGL